MSSADGRGHPGTLGVQAVDATMTLIFAIAMLVTLDVVAARLGASGGRLAQRRR